MSRGDCGESGDLMLRRRARCSGDGGGIMLHVFIFLLRVDSPAILLGVYFDEGVVLLVAATTSGPSFGIGGHSRCLSILLNGLLPGPLVESNVPNFGQKQDWIAHENIVGEYWVGETSAILRQGRSDHSADGGSFLYVGY
jgi:hypothetical protein